MGIIDRQHTRVLMKMVYVTLVGMVMHWGARMFAGHVTVRYVGELTGYVLVASATMAYLVYSFMHTAIDRYIAYILAGVNGSVLCVGAWDRAGVPDRYVLYALSAACAATVVYNIYGFVRRYKAWKRKSS
jgi:hypothetical protein